MRRSAIAGSALAALASCTNPISAALTDPITQGTVFVRLENFASVGSGPVELVHPNDGFNRLFVATKPGQIRLIENGVLQGANYLNIATLFPNDFIITSGNDERGLLGLAFHPGFDAAAGTPGRGKFYTYTSERVNGNTPDFGYVGSTSTAPPTHHSVLREWTADPAADVYNTASASRILMRVAQPQDNHNGGALRFGNDGLLYIASGDGGGSNDEGAGHSSIGNGQDTTNVLGDILRIDPLHPTLTPASVGPTSANQQYRVPAANPFRNGAGPHVNSVDEIFAYGFRNPFRMSFDKRTGRLFVGDVGQGTREEIDIAEIGRNHGWKYYEGTHVFRTGGPPISETVVPIAEYRTRRSGVGDGIAVIGGFVYRGFRIPELHGKYVFGDLGGLTGTQGRLFYLDPDNAPNQNTIFELRYDTGSAPLGDTIFSLGEGPTGELYALLGGGGVRRISGGPTQWERDGAGTWGTGASWTGNAIPNAAGAVANFMGGLVTPRNAPAIVTMDGDKTVGALRFFNDAVNPNGSSPYTYVLNGSGQALRIDNGASEALITTDAGHHRINAGVFMLSSSHLRLHAAEDASLTFAGPFSNTFGKTIRKTGLGVVRFDGGLDASSFTVLDVREGVVVGTTISSQNIFVRGGAALIADRFQNVFDLVLEAGADVQLEAQTFQFPSAVGTLSIAGGVTPTALLDVNQRLRIQTPDLPTLAAQIRYARNDGQYDQPGITSSLAYQSDGTKTVGLVSAGSAALLDVTWFGDADLDLDVDADDYHRIDRGFLLRLSGWENGDNDYSGVIDLDDYARMDAAFVAQSLGLSSVPEPMAGMFAGAALMLLTRRPSRASEDRRTARRPGDRPGR